MHNTPSLLWTLEEIGQLVSGSGNPSETLTNIVNLIQQRFVTDVCSVYLLEPDRTTLVLAATIGLRPESVGLVQDADQRRAGRAGRRAAAAGVRAATRRSTRASSTSARRARIRIARSSACRSSIAACCRACWSCRRSESRAFSDDDLRMLATAGAQLAPIVSEARAVGQLRHAGAPAAVGAGAEPVVGVGRRGGQPVPRARPGAVARMRPQPDRCCCSRSRSRSSRRARRSWPCTGASTTPTAGCRSTCSRSTPGAARTPACSARGRWRTSPPSSACTSRCRSIPAASASWPATT